MFNIKKTVFLISLVIITAIFIVPVWALAGKPVLKSEEIITRGAVLQQYNVSTGKGNSRVYVTKINLKDEFLKIDTIYGTADRLGSNQTVEKMAGENNAIAAINGDFFDMAGGTPLGPLMSNGQWITTPSGIDGMSAFGLSLSSEPVINPFSFEGSITTENGQSFPVASLNKTISRVDKLNVFNSYWNMNNWPTKGLDSYIVVVVDGDKVIEILENVEPSSIPPNAWIILGNGKGAQFLKDNVKLNETIEFNYVIQPTRDWNSVLGGHTVLVSNGKRAVFTKNIPGYRSRTALGYSKDKRYMYWITVECSKQSSGMTLEDLADFMIAIGVDQGVNLDGGGSTTLVSRRPGDTLPSLINIPENGSQRSVPNGLALFSTAPPGEFKAITGLNIPSFLLMNESVPIQYKAVDEYDNPFLGDNESIAWTAKNKYIAVKENQFTGISPGSGVLQVNSGTGKEFSVEVLGRDQISSINFGVPALINGESSVLTPVVKTKSGKERKVSANLFTWEWVGIEGSVQDGVASVNNSATGSGWLIGTYDRFSSMIPIQVGMVNQTLENFEGQPSLKFTGLPEGTKGEFSLCKDDKIDGSFSGKLSYQFSNTTDDMQIAYGQFGDKGLSFPDTSKGISLWVNGNNSDLWLRAEVLDEKGQIQYLTLADKINWTGWKQLSVDFPTTIQSPKLKRIYLVSTKTLSSDNPTKGSILLDQITFKTTQPLPEAINTTIKLFVNKKVMLVNGKEQLIDQGPLVENSRSYIPARYIIEALAGKVFWDPQDKQVRLLLSNKMIDLWVNDKEHTIINGINKPSDTAPIVRNGRTLVPVRMVSENLGYKVEWKKGEVIISNK